MCDDAPMPPCACLKVALPDFSNVDELLQILRRKILARHDDGGRMRGRADRDEVARRVVLDVRRQHRRRDMRAHAARQQRVAVGRRGRDPAAADGAAGAADVLDHQRLAEHLAHLVGDDARDHVARTAGREGHDHGDGTGGIVLGVDGSGNARDTQADSASHGELPSRSQLSSRILLVQSFFKISATSTRRPSRADKMPARTTASEVVA